MAEREILLYPKDKFALRTKSDPINGFNRHIRQLINDLKETLLCHNDAIGLAAPQISEHLRFVTVRLGAKSEWDPEADPPIVLVNPEIIESSDEAKDFDGCLSFPGLFGETIRPHYLRVIGLTEENKPFDRIFTGFDAVLVHHEIDHLDGVLFIDRIECLSDLYQMYIDDQGKPTRVPLSVIVSSPRIMDIAE
jgi:peptide deformylase